MGAESLLCARFYLPAIRRSTKRLLSSTYLSLQHASHSTAVKRWSIAVAQLQRFAAEQ
jgi:hypothetical protein